RGCGRAGAPGTQRRRAPAQNAGGGSRSSERDQQNVHQNTGRGAGTGDSTPMEGRTEGERKGEASNIMPRPPFMTRGHNTLSAARLGVPLANREFAMGRLLRGRAVRYRTAG